MCDLFTVSELIIFVVLAIVIFLQGDRVLARLDELDRGFDLFCLRIFWVDLIIDL